MWEQWKPGRAHRMSPGACWEASLHAFSSRYAKNVNRLMKLLRSQQMARVCLDGQSHQSCRFNMDPCKFVLNTAKQLISNIFLIANKDSLAVQWYMQSKDCSALSPSPLQPSALEKNHKLNIITEPPHRDVFISVELRGSPPSTSENLSDHSPSVIIPSWGRSNAWCACKTRHHVTHCDVGIYNACSARLRACEGGPNARWLQSDARPWLIPSDVRGGWAASHSSDHRLTDRGRAKMQQRMRRWDHGLFSAGFTVTARCIFQSSNARTLFVHISAVTWCDHTNGLSELSRFTPLRLCRPV